MLTIDKAKEIKIANVKCRASTLFHTRYFFVENQKQKFIVNDHHVQICDVIDLIILGFLKKVIINIAPRYSKTELAVINFAGHGFSINPASKFIHLSYSYDLAVNTNSDAIRAQIKSEAYQQLFPNVRIRRNKDSKSKWATTDGGSFYATSTGGQVTGQGAGRVDNIDNVSDVKNAIDRAFDEVASMYDKIEISETFAGALIIDDSIKPEDADSKTIRTRVNERWDSTLKNRVNSRNTPVLIMQQRTHEEDLPGYLKKKEGYTNDIEVAKRNPNIWYVLEIPAIITDPDGSKRALWPFKHTLDELIQMQVTSPISFGRQYMQNPQPKEGFMYRPFKTYNHLPISTTSIFKNYTDTADRGKDYLCSINYLETESGIYLTNVLYTQKPMEDTEPATAVMLTKDKVIECRVEANNGGEGFSRNVEKQCRIIKNSYTEFYPFHQGKNKEVRIFGNSNIVNNLVHMPENWAVLWPEFYTAITTYLKAGGNPFDDAPDALTGCVEFFNESSTDENDDWVSEFL